MAKFIFLGAFYSVLTVVITTMLYAIWRSIRALRRGETEHIRWHSDFHDLPAADRACRHVLTVSSSIASVPMPSTAAAAGRTPNGSCSTRRVPSTSRRRRFSG